MHYYICWFWPYFRLKSLRVCVPFVARRRQHWVALAVRGCSRSCGQGSLTEGRLNREARGNRAVHGLLHATMHQSSARSSWAAIPMHLQLDPLRDKAVSNHPTRRLNKNNQQTSPMNSHVSSGNRILSEFGKCRWKLVKACYKTVTRRCYAELMQRTHKPNDRATRCTRMNSKRNHRARTFHFY